MDREKSDNRRNEFWDYEIAGLPTEYEYLVTSTHKKQGESDPARGWMLGVQQGADASVNPNRWWLTNNTYPEMNLPLDVVMEGAPGSFESTTSVMSPLGRDGYITATRSRRPGQTKSLVAKLWGSSDEEPNAEGIWRDWISRLHDRAKRPRQWCLRDNFGNAWYGTPEVRAINYEQVGANKGTTLELEFWETAFTPTEKVPFQHSFWHFDDPSDRITIDTPDLTVRPKSLTIGRNNFSVMVLCRRMRYSEQVGGFGGSTASYVMGDWIKDATPDPDDRYGWHLGHGSSNYRAIFGIGKGDGGGDDNIGGTAAAGDEGSLAWQADPNGWHTLGGVRGTPDSNSYHGADEVGSFVDAIPNATSFEANDSTVDAYIPEFMSDKELSLGSYSGTASEWEGDIVAAVIWLRALTDDEMMCAHRALMGYPGYSLPPRSALYYDARNPECFVGTTTTNVPVYDLSGWERHGRFRYGNNSAFVPRGG
tara:strand:+ start:7406 stop:8842 length:1437 start_codon:yes stop_codon:yes gene_type:complete